MSTKTIEAPVHQRRKLPPAGWVWMDGVSAYYTRRERLLMRELHEEHGATRRELLVVHLVKGLFDGRLS